MGLFINETFAQWSQLPQTAHWICAARSAKMCPSAEGRCMLARVGVFPISLTWRRLPILHKCILEVPPCYPYEEAVICLTFRLMRLFAIQPRQLSKMDLSEP